MKIDEILTKEEDKYYPLLKSTIDMSPNYPILKGEEQRLLVELEIIHKMQQSKVVWYCYQIVKEAINRNEPYFIRGTMPDLYVLYVLGLTKNNPNENGCCFEASIGTLANPKAGIYFDVSFRWEFVEYIKEFAKKIEPSSKAFHYSYHIQDEPTPYSPSSMMIFPSYIDEKEFCVVKETGDDMPVVGMKNLYSFDIGVQFNLMASKNLSIIKKLQDLYGLPDFKAAFEDFRQLISDEYFTKEAYRKLAEHVDLISFKDALDLEGFSCSSHFDSSDTSSYIFPDRESVFNYLVRDLSMPIDAACDVMEAIRKGAFVKKYKNDIDALIPKAELNDFKNISYLFSRGHAAEFLYWRVLEAYYYKNYPDAYYVVSEAYKE